MGYHCFDHDGCARQKEIIFHFPDGCMNSLCYVGSKGCPHAQTFQWRGMILSAVKKQHVAEAIG